MPSKVSNNLRFSLGIFGALMRETQCRSCNVVRVKSRTYTAISNIIEVIPIPTLQFVMCKKARKDLGLEVAMGNLNGDGATLLYI